MSHSRSSTLTPSIAFEEIKKLRRQRRSKVAEASRPLWTERHAPNERDCVSSPCEQEASMTSRSYRACWVHTPVQVTLCETQAQEERARRLAEFRHPNIEFLLGMTMVPVAAVRAAEGADVLPDIEYVAAAVTDMGSARCVANLLRTEQTIPKQRIQDYSMEQSAEWHTVQPVEQADDALLESNDNARVSMESFTSASSSSISTSTSSLCEDVSVSKDKKCFQSGRIGEAYLSASSKTNKTSRDVSRRRVAQGSDRAWQIVLDISRALVYLHVKVRRACGHVSLDSVFYDHERDTAILRMIPPVRRDRNQCTRESDVIDLLHVAMILLGGIEAIEARSPILAGIVKNALPATRNTATVPDVREVAVLLAKACGK